MESTVETSHGSSETPRAANRQAMSLRLQRAAALLGLVVLCIVFSLMSPYFLQVNNLVNVAAQTAIVAILAIGQTYVIITAGIDLSVGSVAALSGVVVANLVIAGFPIWLASLAALAVGALSGLINGAIISFGNVPPFIATLGMMGVARGVVLVMTGGVPIAGLPREFGLLGAGSVFGVPYSVILMVAIALVASLLLRRSVFGRHVFAVGSNESAAFLSGIHVARTKIYVYVISGFVAAIGGIVLTSQLVSAAPTAGTGYELSSIAATVIGGASLSGGVGGIAGTFIGAFVMGVLQNGLNLVGFSYYWQQIAIGIVIVAAVFLDSVRKRRAK